MATKKDERVRAQENMVLRDADRRAFLEAVSKPPRPSPRLVQALQQHARQQR
jgi:uncharacterized protein (DUF1778 family)